MKKRVFLDEDIDPSLSKVFGARAHVYTAKALGVLGCDDTAVITAAIKKGCLIVTANKDFIGYYRKHPLRGPNSFFYGLIFLSAHGSFEQKRQLRDAMKQFSWAETRMHDGLVVAYSDGKVCREWLCHVDCAKDFAEQERQRRKHARIGPSRYAPIAVSNAAKAS
jgi:Domain of unknown function (DUF5615)